MTGRRRQRSRIRSDNSLAAAILGGFRVSAVRGDAKSLAELAQDFLDNSCRLDAGQPLIKTQMADGETLVIEAEQVQDRRLPVVQVNRIFHDVVGEIVGFAVDCAWFDAAAAHPDGEAAGMMV